MALSDFDAIMAGAIDAMMSSPLAARHTYRQPNTDDYLVLGVFDWGPAVEERRPGMAGSLWARASEFQAPPAKRDYLIANGVAYMVVEIEKQQYGDYLLWLREDANEPVVQSAPPTP